MEESSDRTVLGNSEANYQNFPAGAVNRSFRGSSELARVGDIRAQKKVER